MCLSRKRVRRKIVMMNFDRIWDHHWSKPLRMMVKDFLDKIVNVGRSILNNIHFSLLPSNRNYVTSCSHSLYHVFTSLKMVICKFIIIYFNPAHITLSSLSFMLYLKLTSISTCFLFPLLWPSIRINHYFPKFLLLIYTWNKHSTWLVYLYPSQ